MDNNSENAFSDVSTKLDAFQDYSKKLILAKEKLKIMFRFENGAGTLIFMLRHFDQMIGQTTILILYALLLLL